MQASPSPHTSGAPHAHEQQVQVSDRHVMVDLNKGHRKFYADFDVSADGGGEFDILVVNQAQLDQIGPSKLALRTVRDTTSGNVRADSDDYQDYYLILRSAAPRTLTIKTRVTPLGDKVADTSAAEETSAPTTRPSAFLSFFRVRSWSDLPSSRVFWLLIGLIFIAVVWCIFSSRQGKGTLSAHAPVALSDHGGSEDDAASVDTASGTSPLSQAVRRFLSSQPVEEN